MADSRCASSAFTTVFHAATRRELQKPSKTFSISASKRRNHLRPKILETLVKPYPSTTLPLPFEPQSIPEFVILSPNAPTLPVETPSGDSSTGALELQVSDTYSGGVGFISTRSVLNVCLCLIGAIVIHICHGVWFLRKTVCEGEQEDGNLEKLELGVQETNTAGNSFFSENQLKQKIEDILNRGGSSISLDGSNLKDEIEEIRRMAREVRRGEGSQLGSNVGHGDGEDRSEIEKQIGWGLARVQRGEIKSQKSVKVGDAKIPNDVDFKEPSKEMIFKEKGLKAIRPYMEPRSKPKGFEGLDNDDACEEKSDSGVIDTSVGSVYNDRVGLIDGEKQVNLQGGELLPSVSRSSDGSDGKNLKKSGTNSIARAEFGSDESRTGKHRASKRSDSREKAVASEVKDKQSYINTDPWWLNLPYVLTISMRRSSEGEGPEGLFSLQVASEAQEHRDSAYTVAFENYGDANNFCHLVESFFEDIDDFSAGIAPMPTKDLHEAVKSNAMKVVVVRKGELKLYVGQPLTDVEMDLHSLIEQTQSATNIPN